MCTHVYNPQGLPALLPLMSDGTFVCWLVERVLRVSLVGVNRRPMGSTPAARANWMRAIRALREAPPSINGKVGPT